MMPWAHYKNLSDSCRPDTVRAGIWNLVHSLYLTLPQFKSDNQISANDTISGKSFHSNR